MSARKKPGRTRQHITGKPVAKSISKASPARQGAGTQLPDLEAIFDAFLDAFMLVRVACRLMEEGDLDDYGAAILVLRQGVDALDVVSDKLENADIQFRAARKNTSSGGMA